MQSRKYVFGKYYVALSYIRWVFDTVCYDRKENVKLAEGNFGNAGEGGRKLLRCGIEGGAAAAQAGGGKAQPLRDCLVRRIGRLGACKRQAARGLAAVRLETPARPASVPEADSIPAVYMQLPKQKAPPACCVENDNLAR